MKNWGSKLVVTLVALGVVGALALSLAPQPVDVDLAPIGRATVRVTVDEDGKTRVRDKYVVSAPLGGRLLRIGLDPGDAVRAGRTLLATIEPRDPELLDARTIAQAEAAVRGAQASLDRAAPALEQAVLRQANAETELARLRRIATRGALAESELDDAELAFAVANQEVRAARYAREIAEFELEQARAALLRSRPGPDGAGDLPPPAEAGRKRGGPGAGDSNAAEPNEAGWNFAIHSPIDGRVLRVFQESSAVVAAGAALLELGDPADLEVEVDVLSSDAVRIHPGDRAELLHWGGDKPLEARVRLVEPSGFTKVSTLGVEEQRVNVILDLVDPIDQRRALGDGFRVEASIITDQADDVLAVPTSALFRTDAGGWAVFRVREGVARQTPIELGLQSGLLAEVTAGLDEGDRVVEHPSDAVADGVSVRPR